MALTKAEEKRMKELLKKEELQSAKDNFWLYCVYMDEKFFVDRAEVLKDIAYAMQSLLYPTADYKELDILNISLTPRTGKSYLCSLFVSWIFGKNREESIMRCTVTAKLYDKFSRDIKAIMMGESHKGRYKDVFPDIVFLTTPNEGWTLKDARQGVSYFGSGFEGTIIGFGATLLSIVDDSVADEEEALSENALDKKWGWYGSAMDSREEQGCKKLFIGTRWSKKDIVGRLEELGFFDDDRARSIVIPALDEKGKSFCEKVQTTKKLYQKKKILDPVIWEAEYMQHPIEAVGLLFPMDELNKFSMKELREADGIMGFTDTADQGTDYLCSVIGRRIGGFTYITNVYFTQEGVEITEPELARMIIDTKCQIMQVESNTSGKPFADNLRKILKNAGCMCRVIFKLSTTNKETRILMNSGYIKEFFYFRNDYKMGSHYDKYMRQLTSYVKLAKDTKDDAVDGTTGLAIYMQRNFRLHKDTPLDSRIKQGGKYFMTELRMRGLKPWEIKKLEKQGIIKVIGE